MPFIANSSPTSEFTNAQTLSNSLDRRANNGEVIKIMSGSQLLAQGDKLLLPRERSSEGTTSRPSFAPLFPIKPVFRPSDIESKTPFPEYLKDVTSVKHNTSHGVIHPDAKQHTSKMATTPYGRPLFAPHNYIAAQYSFHSSSSNSSLSSSPDTSRSSDSSAGHVQSESNNTILPQRGLKGWQQFSEQHSPEMISRRQQGNAQAIRQKPSPPQSPKESRQNQRAAQCAILSQPVWGRWSELRVKVRRPGGAMPLFLRHQDIHHGLKKEGNISYIERFPDGNWRVCFRPPPSSAFWDLKGSPYHLDTFGNGSFDVALDLERPRDEPRHVSPIDNNRTYPERMELKAKSLDFGVMAKANQMMIKKHIDATEQDRITFRVDMRFERIEIEFTMSVRKPESSTETLETFKLSLPFRYLKAIKQLSGSLKDVQLLIEQDIPPAFYRKLNAVLPSAVKDQKWNDYNSWFRQTDIGMSLQQVRKSSLSLKKANPFLDIGRWTAYCLSFEMSPTDVRSFSNMQEAILDYNVEVLSTDEVKFTKRKEPTFWRYIDPPTDTSAEEGLLGLSGDTKTSLSFDVRYQLEVCISRGILNEHNLTEEFANRLSKMDQTSAKELLEHTANQPARIFSPMSIFHHDLTMAVANPNVPDYCAFVRSVVVTPTTLKFNTPTVETSNRVIRQFAEHSDRFIRVRFTEEGPGQKISWTDKETSNELFTRIKRTFANGIRVGDRKYEFLAFGNSQFREHGAYFFAPLPNLSKWEIRAWMGSFDHIKHVALFASRLGQCFSTTRAIATQGKLDLKEIQDIEFNGFTFSDGVGKISSTLALAIADTIDVSQRGLAPPSVFQFRLGGCKGVLAVWPDVEGNEILIRETQYKFPAVHEGLEIIRYSQFASANLNRQIILVLSTLGVPDEVFVGKLETQLKEIEEAMTDSEKALKILKRDVDHNQMTLKLAGMILDGFQDHNEPFIKSLLRLWRAWSMKYLKEKARITLDKGALLLGIVDETGILRGHHYDFLELSEDVPIHEKLQNMPQVFVQISKGPRGSRKVITGPMLLARNPSLHPGDIRVVCGIDIPELHHLTDCVVLPRQGDRDVASMCSGGDLDGDDFEIIWDHSLLPREWNHEPMDYTPPAKLQHKGPVTDHDLTNFFIEYIKSDTLPTIAHAHVALADWSDNGVKDEKCIELAGLHSKAVDFVKTGQPAVMTDDLKPKKWPHFMEKKKPAKQIYHSQKVLGQLYDRVERVAFEPDFTAPFDEKVLSAFELDAAMIDDIKTIKLDYDNHMHRIMAQHAIKTEFEVWTTFVMEHNHSNDYKLQEEMSQITTALKDKFKGHCIEKAGGNDYAQLAPFVAAMYKLTADEVQAAIDDCLEQGREMKASDMPLISFPWLFQDIVGRIANGLGPDQAKEADALKDWTVARETAPMMSQMMKAQTTKPVANADAQDDLRTPYGITHQGDVLQLKFNHGEVAQQRQAVGSATMDKQTWAGHYECKHGFSGGLRMGGEEEEEEEEEAEEVIVQSKARQPTVFDRLASLGASDDDDAFHSN